MSQICAKMTKAGKRCKSYTQASSQYCFIHDPKRAQARLSARKLGGYNSHRTRRSAFPRCDITTVKGLIEFVDNLIHDTWSMGKSVSRVRALGRLTEIQKDLVSLRDSASSNEPTLTPEELEKQRKERWKKVLPQLAIVMRQQYEAEHSEEIEKRRHELEHSAE